MKTAVEFLIDWMNKNQYFIGNDLLKAVEEAKEMEKEQKHELKEKYFIKGYVGAELDNLRYDDSSELSAKELFNELTKQQEQ